MTKTYNTGKEILMNYNQSLKLPANVNNTAAVANEEGRKIIKAGTPLGAAKPFRRDPNNVVLTPVTDGTAQAIALHDIDITDGAKSDTVVVRGDFVFENADKDVQDMFTADVQTALKLITLV